MMTQEMEKVRKAEKPENSMEHGAVRKQCV